MSGPNAATNITFDKQKAQCSIMARHGGTGFAATGNASFVAGAAAGHAIGDGVRANQDFNDCMVAAGYVIADEQAAAAGQCRTVTDLRMSLPPCN
jgi:hypothetical protein